MRNWIRNGLIRDDTSEKIVSREESFSTAKQQFQAIALCATDGPYRSDSPGQAVEVRRDAFQPRFATDRLGSKCDSSNCDQLLHFSNCTFQAHKHGSSDDAVPDIQLAGFLDPGNRNDVAIGQTVAHME